MSNQCELLKINFEILVSEDGGKQYTQDNLGINAIENCSYLLHSKNLGRSGNINRLLRQAKYELTLILDCDTLPSTIDFIKNYIDFAKGKNSFACFGGIAYQTNQDHRNSLRYNYGVKREAKLAKERLKRPYKFLLTSNILLYKCPLLFDEKIQTYGYEDLVFSNQLKAKGFNIYHIDNPVYHTNLEDNDTYIQKTQTALITLTRLEKNDTLVTGETRISQLFHKFKGVGLKFLLKGCANLSLKTIKHVLKQKGKPLWLFDVYKLFYFSKNY